MATKIEMLAVKHADRLKQLSFALATDFEATANNLINHACYDMGIDRVTYERITAYQNGVEYKPVPPRLLKRWATE